MKVLRTHLRKPNLRKPSDVSEEVNCTWSFLGRDSNPRRVAAGLVFSGSYSQSPVEPQSPEEY